MKSSAFADTPTVGVSAKADDFIGCDFMSLGNCSPHSFRRYISRGNGSYKHQSDVKSQPMESSAFADTFTVGVSAKADDSIGCDFMSLGAHIKQPLYKRTNWKWAANSLARILASPLSDFDSSESL